MPEFSLIDWLNTNSEIVQWIIAAILAISAGLVIWQISEQTKSRKGANFVKAIELLNEKTMVEGVDSIYSFSKSKSAEKDQSGIPLFRGIEELKKSDELLPSDIKNDVVKIRETYHSVGVLLITGLIDKIPFLMLQSSQGRDMWELLYDNIELMRKERQKDENDVPQWRGFEFIGKLCNYWSIISFEEKRFLASYPYLIPLPDSLLYKFRLYLHRKFQKKIKEQPK